MSLWIMTITVFQLNFLLFNSIMILSKTLCAQFYLKLFLCLLQEKSLSDFKMSKGSLHDYYMFLWKRTTRQIRFVNSILRKLHYSYEYVSRVEKFNKVNGNIISILLSVREPLALNKSLLHTFPFYSSLQLSTFYLIDKRIKELKRLA